MKEYKNGVLILIVLIIISIFLLYSDPSITGLIIYEYQESTQTWDLNNLNYNSNEIEYSNNLKLKLQIEDNSYTETLTNFATITSAIYDGNDKTNKVTNVGSGQVNVNKNKIFDVTFNQELNNNDIINLYLKGNDDAIMKNALYRHIHIDDFWKLGFQ